MANFSKRLKKTQNKLTINKETIKEFMPLMQAMLEGKTIQFYYEQDKEWVDVDEIFINDGLLSYRIKSEPKYRPFANAEECWAEMQKHQPFGWLKRKDSNEYNLLTSVDGSVECEDVRIDSDGFDWDSANDEFIFEDGTPFGIKEGE